MDIAALKAAYRAGYVNGACCFIGEGEDDLRIGSEQSWDMHRDELCADPSILSLIARLERAEAALSGITLLIGNVDHSAGGGENTARMYGVMLNDIRGMVQS